MSRRRRRYAIWAALALIVGALAFLAAGCGGDDDEGGSATQIEGLGEDLDEIKEMAREEGQVNLVIWSAYDALSKEFTAETGCKVNTKDGASSDDMIDQIATGEYDGVSASGNASVRLMEKGDAAPVDTELIPNYADVHEGIKNQPYNSRDDQPYGVPHGRGPNYLMYRTDVYTDAPDSWAVIWDKIDPSKGPVSIYDDSIFIADAAVYLKATQPDLGITNPYELDEKQFQAAIDLLKAQSANAKYWRGDDVAGQIADFKSKNVAVGTTWPYQYNVLTADKQPVKAIKPKEGTTGWSDTWMIYSKAQNPNCMYLWMNHIISPEAQAWIAETFGEAPANLKACELTKDKNHCETYHADDEAWWEDIYYWTTPVADCGDERGEVCKTQEEWKAAWTEIRG